MSTVLEKTSYLNGIAVDPDNGFAFISDSGLSQNEGWPLFLVISSALASKYFAIHLSFKKLGIGKSPTLDS